MKLILDRKPYLLYETVGMLVKYVNRISFLEIRDTMQRLYRGCFDEVWNRRLECLQTITDEVCGDLNREDEEIQYFFSRREVGNNRDATTMARVMTTSFLQYLDHSLEGETQVLKTTWEQMQSVGFRLYGSLSGIAFGPLQPGEKRQSLFRQIYGLGFQGDFAMEVLNVLEDYSGNLDRLVRLIAPYARRLEERLAAQPWLMESIAAYWQEQFQEMPPEKFLGDSKVGYREPPVNSERRVCFSLMDCTELHWETADSILHPERSLFVFGSVIIAECSRRMYSEDLDWICAAFRTLGDKSKMELLMRLAEGRSYCQQLAEEARCNTGNMSRNLTALAGNGFLKQEREQSRTYYTTDLDGISRFFREVEDLFARRGPA